MSRKANGEEIKTPDFGQIPFHLICRFGELTKFEIRALCILYAARNQDTRQCNPRRRLIVEWAKMDRANLYRTLVGLESKGWIVEPEKNNYLLVENPPPPEDFVVKSTTKKQPILLSNQQHDVVESTTQNNKDLKNIKRTYKTSLSEPSSDASADFDFKVDVRAYEIFVFWQNTLNKKRSKYNEKTQKLIIRALSKWKFTAEELQTAIKGVSLSDFHLGKVNGTKYLEFKTIFRDTEQIEKFIEMAEDFNKTEIVKDETTKENDQETAYREMMRAVRQSARPATVN